MNNYILNEKRYWDFRHPNNEEFYIHRIILNKYSTTHAEFLVMRSPFEKPPYWVQVVRYADYIEDSGYDEVDVSFKTLEDEYIRFTDEFTLLDFNALINNIKDIGLKIMNEHFEILEKRKNEI